jgi:hypothetical protein
MTVFLTSGHPGTLLARISIFGVFSRPDPVQDHHGMTLNRDFSGQALWDDKVSGFQGRLCVLALLHVAGVLLARI